MRLNLPFVKSLIFKFLILKKSLLGCGKYLLKLRYFLTLILNTIFKLILIFLIILSYILYLLIFYLELNFVKSR